MSTPFSIILASQSPRRQQFLRELGIEFSIEHANIDESPLPGEAPHNLVSRLSEEKARVISEKFPKALVIAADTIVVLNDVVLGKPIDAVDAQRMLTALRNRRHYVLSSISLLQGIKKQHFSAVNSTTIIMRNYSDAEIDAYIATGDPLDKAGAYAIQHKAFAPAFCWDGCYASVMGFPLYDLSLGLAQFGVVLSGVGPVCSGISGVTCCATF